MFKKATSIFKVTSKNVSENEIVLVETKINKILDWKFSIEFAQIKASAFCLGTRHTAMSLKPSSDIFY